MVAGLLHLPTATWGGRMGLYLLSTLVLSGSTPLGISATIRAELEGTLLHGMCLLDIARVQYLAGLAESEFE